jgi:hypothetical protein
MMSELTIRAFLNDGGKLKKVKADDQTIKDIEKYVSKLIQAENEIDVMNVDIDLQLLLDKKKKLKDSIVTSIKNTEKKEKK